MRESWHCRSVFFALCVAIFGSSFIAGAQSPGSAAGKDVGPKIGPQELAGSTRGESCSPFMLAHFERAQTTAAALVNSPAFRACVVDRMEESYLDCVDDASFPTFTAAAHGLLDALAGGTHIVLSCSNREGGVCGAGGACPAGTVCRDGYCSGIQDWAGLGAYQQYQPTRINISAFWTRENWYGDIAAGRRSNPAYPWDATADTTLHEFAHTQGYDHVRDEACAARIRGRSYYAYGEPSAPYILGECATAAVRAIYRDRGNLWSCTTDHVRLPAFYNRSVNDPTDDVPPLSDGFSGSTCVRTLRYRAWIAAFRGQYVRAQDGGGGEVNAVSPGPGDWETFYIIDRNGEELRSGDVINLRTSSGHFLRVNPAINRVEANGTSGGDLQAQFKLLSVTPYFPPAAIVKPGGDAFFLYSLGMRQWVSALRGGGAGLGTTISPLGNAETFRLELPRRTLAISLDTNRGARVTYDPGSALLSTRPAEGPGKPEARNQMFWVINHNGRTLAHNDEVSFEGSRIASFISTCASGTGNVQGDSWWANSCSRFRIQRLAGPGRILNGDQVRLVSNEQTRYLEATTAGRIRNSATAATPAGVFTVRYTQGDAFDIE